MNPWMSREVHLWTAYHEDVSYLDAQLRTFLSAEEQERLAKYLVAAPRQQFLRSRGLLRLLLSQYLNCSPLAIQFQYLAQGKPTLAPEVSHPVQFNIAHSQDCTLFAFSQDLALGVDLEYVDDRCHYREIAQRFLREEEWQNFAQINAEQQKLAFFRIWSRKEALIKLWGDSLFQGLQLYPVPTSVHPEQFSVISREQTIYLQDLDLNPRFTAALATFEQPSLIKYYWCSPETLLI
jgi:4'-phosphopantetheinyl transferase